VDKRLLLSAVAVTVMGAGVAAYVVARPDPPPATRPTTARLRTVRVERTDLSLTAKMAGTLGYGATQTVTGAGEGVITSLPSPGTVLGRGDEAARVDDQPVIVFYGRTPLFRDLDRVGLVGRDVKVVADNLAALGYDIGSQPRVGRVITAAAGPAASPAASPNSDRKGDAAPPKAAGRAKVRAGDRVLTRPLLAAIATWRDRSGMRSDVLRAADVLVLPGKVRVLSQAGKVGGSGTGPLLTVASSRKSVTVRAESRDLSSVHLNQKVRITLPSQKVVGGVVRSISTTAKEQENEGAADDHTLTQDVAVSVDDGAAIEHLDSASVTVEFPTQTKKGVLAVPVNALIAPIGGGYALQPAEGPLIAVNTGLFADGMVEVSGPGVSEGLPVVAAR
jgi:hypothetical protein